MSYMVRKIKSEEYESAMKLILDVYMEFEAPVYGEEGERDVRISTVPSAGHFHLKLCE